MSKKETHYTMVLLSIWVSACGTPALGPANVDETPPMIRLEGPSGPLLGGARIVVPFSVSDDRALARVSLLYARDGEHFVTVLESVDSSATEVAWTVAKDDTRVARLRMEAEDTAGHQTRVDSEAFVIDSTTPARRPSFPTLKFVSKAALKP